jgi:hypothetical protein
MSVPKKLISICSPAYNESDCIEEMARRLALVFDSLSDRYDFEAIFCENGSADDTYEKLTAIRERDPRFKVVRLSRNFGTEGGLTAALAHARGSTSPPSSSAGKRATRTCTRSWRAARARAPSAGSARTATIASSTG